MRVWKNMQYSCAFLFSLISMVALAADVPDESAWQSRLKTFYFQDQVLNDANDVIELTMPARAEDSSMVPVQIRTKIAQTPVHYIEQMWLVIDNNPSPLAGHFTLTPKLGRADMDFLVRVDAYTPVHLVARTNDGKLYVAEQYVKASGGCSAPVAGDMQTALSRLGKIRMKSDLSDSLLKPVETTLTVSHPNITGLQKDQVTTLFIPPRYIKEFSVNFDGEPILRAETDISISANPSFKFYFIPEHKGKLTATITDTDNKTFTQDYDLAAE